MTVYERSDSSVLESIELNLDLIRTSVSEITKNLEAARNNKYNFKDIEGELTEIRLKTQDLSSSQILSEQGFKDLHQTLQSILFWVRQSGTFHEEYYPKIKTELTALNFKMLFIFIWAFNQIWDANSNQSISHWLQSIF